MELSSLGCRTCKARHLKCDKATPVCQRCEKSRRICYRARAVIHSENSYASRQKKRPRGPRSVETQELVGIEGVSLQPALVTLKSQALAYYLRYHLPGTRNIPSLVKTQYDTFLPIWRIRNDSQILDLCASSMALAVFAQVHKYPQAAIEASMQYQQLLQVARSEMISLNEKDLEICLLASFFMGRYEDVIYRPRPIESKTPFNATLPSAAHHDGALAILKNWKIDPNQHECLSEVVKHGRRGLIRSAIMRGRSLPDWMADGARFGEHGLDLQYDSVCVRLVNLRQRFYALQHAEIFRMRLAEDILFTAKELIREAEDIDNALQEWTKSFPNSWSARKHTLPERYSKHFYSTEVNSYVDSVCAAIWTMYHAHRMLINSTHWKLLRLIQPEADILTDQQSLDCHSNLQTAAHDLATTLPFSLQRFNVSDTTSENSSLNQDSTISLSQDENPEAYVSSLVVWPLTIASSLGDVDVKLKLWFRSELASIGRSQGARVLECAETDRWLEL